MNPTFTSIGKNVYSRLQELRPKLFNALWQSDRLNQVISEAENHFHERTMHFNNLYQEKYPRPTQIDRVLKYMTDREAFVKQSIDAEIDNWVSNLSNQSQKIA
jgi:hypothetical protein